ncbi:MAG: hypothetical protein AB1749_17275 [Pseudomonadota bacterium]
MLVLENIAISVLLAIGLSIAMAVVAFFTWFYHDTKHRELDSWVEFGFSRDTLRHALLYYRSMGISMLVFYVLFVVNCLLLQADGYPIFALGKETVSAGPVGVAFFALDLVLRGGFFDIMEHFDLAVTAFGMNRAMRWFVWYCFVFRMYYGLTLIRIAVSFVWIWTKIQAARKKTETTLPFGS